MVLEEVAVVAAVAEDGLVKLTRVVIYNVVVLYKLLVLLVLLVLPVQLVGRQQGLLAVLVITVLVMQVVM